MPNLRTDIYECQIEKDDSERRNQEDMMALNAKLKKVKALNAKLEMRLWTSNWRSGSKLQIENMALNVELRRMKALNAVIEN